LSDLALPEWHAHCGCWLTVGQDGEPVDFLKRCEAHLDAAPADIAAENRAMSVVRMAVSSIAKIDIGDTWATIDPKTRHATCVSPDGQWSATMAPVSLPEYLAKHAIAETLATRA
jgi:hypothetical protein